MDEQPQKLPVLPAFCQAGTVLWAILLAQAVAVLLALAPGVTEDRWLRLGFSSLFVQWVSLLTIALLCLLRRRLDALPANRLGLVVLLLLFIVTSLVSLAAWSTLTRVGWEPRVPPGLFILHNLAIAAVVGVIGMMIFSMHLERSQRVAAQSRAELDALQARIRPHFLFNSLNTVAGLIPGHPREAETALLDLSSLFRAALHAGEQSTLREEIELTRQYLALEQWRLAERLTVDWQLPDQLPEVAMPALTLQPLVENAVRHGIEPSRDGGCLRVSVQASARSLTLLVENPMPEEPARRTGNGVALDNIRQRLTLLHGDQARLTAGLVDGRYRAKLVLPRNREEA